MSDYFSSNLKKLALHYSQKQIAEDTGMSPASITNYISGVSEPSMYFLTQLKNAYNIDLDTFLFQDLSDIQIKTDLQESVKRFGGNYLIYYYDSSFYKGANNVYTKNALNYGIVSVFYDPDAVYENSLNCYALFLLERKEAEDIVKVLNQLKNPKQIKTYYANLNDKYEGSLSVNNSHIFIRLKNLSHEDEVFLILNNPPSRKTYIGGIATVNSISRGREHMPCIQYAIFTRYTLTITDGEIYNLLTLNTPDIGIDLETEQLIKLFKSLYIDPQNNLNLTDYQKKRIIEESLKNTLNELLENNVFRYAKISDMEDDKYYRIIKEEMLNEWKYIRLQKTIWPNYS